MFPSLQGIVVLRLCGQFSHVFPFSVCAGEKHESIFCCGDLRHSQEWLGGVWTHLKDRPDLVSSILSCSERKPVAEKSSEGKSAQATICGSRLSRQDETESNNSRLDSEYDKVKSVGVVPDLSKDLCAQLRWKSSRKRRRGGGFSGQKLRSSDNDSRSTSSDERFLIPLSMKVVDHENCKYIGDSLFSTSVVSPLASLVMSR